MARYAEKTSVPVEKSKAEIEKMLNRYGATSFMYGNKKQGGEYRALIAFEINSKQVRFMLPLPSQDDPEFQTTPGGRRKRNVEAMLRAWEQACRQRWRALALVIKAKLEAVDTGITTFEEEFLAHILLPNNQTVGDSMIPMIEQAYTDGKMPKLQLCFDGDRRSSNGTS